MITTAGLSFWTGICWTSFKLRFIALPFINWEKKPQKKNVSNIFGVSHLQCCKFLSPPEYRSEHDLPLVQHDPPVGNLGAVRTMFFSLTMTGVKMRHFYIITKVTIYSHSSKTLGLGQTQRAFWYPAPPCLWYSPFHCICKGTIEMCYNFACSSTLWIQKDYYYSIVWSFLQQESACYLHRCYPQINFSFKGFAGVRFCFDLNTECGHISRCWDVIGKRYLGNKFGKMWKKKVEVSQVAIATHLPLHIWGGKDFTLDAIPETTLLTYKGLGLALARDGSEK